MLRGAPTGHDSSVANYRKQESSVSQAIDFLRSDFRIWPRKDNFATEPSRLTVVLAGHPRLKNELRRPAREETGARTTVFELEGIQGQQRRYITWLLEQCAPSMEPLDIVTPEALDLLAERLLTPLQIQHYVTRVLEQAYRLGEKPVTPAIVHMTLAPDLHDLEPTLTRYGYNVTALAELLNIRQADVRAFLRGQLPPGRTEELHNQLLATGIPLHDRTSDAGQQAVAGEV